MIKPDFIGANWNKSLALLLTGDFDNGWKLFEWRWQLEENQEIAKKHQLKTPLWSGTEPLIGKTILLYVEQGLGDIIQFCRFTKQVSDLGAKVILEVPKALIKLLSELEGVDQIVVIGDPLPFFDYQCSLMSLPLAFKTDELNIPKSSPYLFTNSIDASIWKRRLGIKTKKRIGLVWSGNIKHKNDNNRSIQLQDLLLYLPDCFEYVSLQKEVRENDIGTLQNNQEILQFSSELKDFTDTAALINCLDLVISVDTSVAHLAGALGKPTWVLLPYVPDWRWMLNRDDSPWYPSITLFRQSSNSDWRSVFEKLNKALFTLK
jgi:hypothetical protein